MHFLTLICSGLTGWIVHASAQHGFDTPEYTHLRRSEISAPMPVRRHLFAPQPHVSRMAKRDLVEHLTRRGSCVSKGCIRPKTTASSASSSQTGTPRRTRISQDGRFSFQSSSDQSFFSTAPSSHGRTGSQAQTAFRTPSLDLGKHQQHGQGPGKGYNAAKAPGSPRSSQHSGSNGSIDMLNTMEGPLVPFDQGIARTSSQESLN